jgi:DNA-binding MarR family transcriptional regulator
MRLCFENGAETALTLTLQDFLPYMLNQASEAVSLDFQHVYKDRYGMLRTEWRVLFHLGVYGDMTARDICALAMIHKTKVSRAVNALEKKRYLLRAPDSRDRRIERLALTPAGKTVFRDLKQAATEHEAKIAARLDPEEMAKLKQILGKLTLRP